MNMNVIGVFKVVKCLLCGKEFKALTNSGHLRKHNVNREYYLNLFPDAVLISEETRKTRSEVAKANIINGNHFIPFRDVPGLAKKIHHKYKEKDRSKFKYKCIRCGKVKTVRCKTLAKKRIYCSNKCHMMYIKEHEDLRKAFSEKVSEATTGIRKNGGYSRSKGGIREDLGHYVRSGWEADVCRIFNYHKKPYEYEQYSISLKDGSKNLTWIIDFVDKKKLLSKGLIEVKGWWDEKSKKKLEFLKSQYPDIYKKLTIIDFHKMKELILKYKNVITGWESSK